MSYHTLLSKLEDSCAAYLSATVTGIGTVLKTSDVDQLLSARACHVMATNGTGLVGVPGNYSVTLTVELRTNLNLYKVRGTALSNHSTLWGSIADAMMDDGLLTSLDDTYGTDISIQGIHTGNDIGYSKRGDDTLVNSITRMIEACPQ